MLRLIGAFLLGVYVGQEYGKQIPDVKDKTMELYSEFKRTELYKSLEEKLKKK